MEMAVSGCCSTPQCLAEFAQAPPVLSGVRWCGFEDVKALMLPHSVGLKHYLTHIYGQWSQQAFARWNWSFVDVVHLDYVPHQGQQQLRNCSWPASVRAARVGDSYLISPFSKKRSSESIPLSSFVDEVLFIHNLPYRGCRSPDGFDFTTLLQPLARNVTRLAPGHSWLERLQRPQSHNLDMHAARHYFRSSVEVSERAGWIEIMHHKERGTSHLTWMYAARGSGVWYHMRRTVFVPDHRTCQCLHLHEAAIVYDSANCTNDFRALQPHFDTVVITHRAEKWLGMFTLPEVIALSGGTAACPPLPLAQGFGANISETCNCSSSHVWTNCGGAVPPPQRDVAFRSDWYVVERRRNRTERKE